jgi:hypothetical protein
VAAAALAALTVAAADMEANYVRVGLELDERTTEAAALAESVEAKASFPPSLFAFLLS